MTGPCIADTPTVSLVASGSPLVLSGNVNISADAGNALAAHADGLWAGSGATYIDATSAMPGSPYDGQLVYKSAGLPTEPVVWAFRYRSASLSADGYKWECIGAAPIVSMYGTPVAIAPVSGSTLFTFGAGTLDASLGDGTYRVDIEGEADVGQSMSWELWLRFNAESEPPVAIRRANVGFGAAGSTSGRVHMANSVLVVIPAGALLTLRAHNYDPTFTQTFYRSSASITPVRIHG